MPSAYTHYWRLERIEEGDQFPICNQAFSSQFIQRGVSKGDRVFFISFHGKRLHLVGAITVSADPFELEDGIQQITAVPGSGSVMDFSRTIPTEVSKNVTRLNTGEHWKFVSEEELDPQTLRGVQKIAPVSALLLDNLLGISGGDYFDTEHDCDDSTDEIGLYPEELSSDRAYLEGSVTQVIVNRYERDPAARKACLDHYRPVCIVCEFNFFECYGDLGAGFIHVHHTKPISSLGPDYVINPITDLVPVCPNCHAMFHRKDPRLGINQLREIYDMHLSLMADETEKRD